MRKVVVTVLLLFLVGCGKEVAESGFECQSDSDCVTGGCSGTVCESKDAPLTYTTCVYSPEFDCYKDIECGCVEGKCEWKKTSAFEECVQRARESDAEIVA
jgi:eight-cysteine-cluster-containing protein